MVSLGLPQDGPSTSFWDDVWVDGVPLRVRFLRLFQVSILQSSSVGGMCSWVDDEWVRDMIWRCIVYLGVPVV